MEVDIEKGKKLLIEKKYQEAHEWFDNLIKAHPDSPLSFRLFSARGAGSLGLGKFKDADVDFDQSIKLNPNFSKPYYYKGVLAFQQHHYKEGLSYIDKSLSLDSTYSKAYLYRGKLNNELENYPEALEDLTKAIELDQKCAIAYADRAKSHNGMQQYDEALLDVKMALIHDPKSGEAFLQKATAHSGCGNFGEALLNYEKAQEMNPKNWKPLIGKGNLYLKQNKVKEAMELFEKAIKTHPKEGKIYAARGLALRQLKKNKQSFADFQKAIELSPDCSITYIYRGRIYYNTGKFEQALSDVTKSIQLNPYRYTSHYLRGLINKKLKNFKAMQADMLAAINISPGNPLSLLELANCYVQLNLSDQAKEYFQKGRLELVSRTEESLIRKYQLTKNSLRSITKQMDDYFTQQEELTELKEISQQQGRSDLLQQLGKLGNLNQLIAIQGSIDQTGITESGQEKEKEIQLQMIKDLNMMKEEIQRMKKELNIKDLKINKLEQRVDTVEEQQKQLHQVMKKMESKVFAVEQVLKKIDSIHDSKIKQYYNLLYNCIINNFLAYRICSTGFFSQKTRSFTKHTSLLSFIFKAQPIVKKIPLIGELVELPFKIMEKYREVKSQFLNEIISKKIASSNFKTQSQITEYMAFVIEHLMEKKAFNLEIEEAIKKEESSYFMKLVEIKTQAKETVYSKLFGSTKPEFSYVHEVIVAHLTLITTMLYEVEEAKFQQASKDKEAFFMLVLSSISPSARRPESPSKRKLTKSDQRKKDKCEIY